MYGEMWAGIAVNTTIIPNGIIALYHIFSKYLNLYNVSKFSRQLRQCLLNQCNARSTAQRYESSKFNSLRYYAFLNKKYHVCIILFIVKLDIN